MEQQFVERCETKVGADACKDSYVFNGKIAFFYMPNNLGLEGLKKCHQSKQCLKQKGQGITNKKIEGNLPYFIILFTRYEYNFLKYDARTNH